MALFDLMPAVLSLVVMFTPTLDKLLKQKILLILVPIAVFYVFIGILDSYHAKDAILTGRNFFCRPIQKLVIGERRIVVNQSSDLLRTYLEVRQEWNLLVPGLILVRYIDRVEIPPPIDFEVIDNHTIKYNGRMCYLL